MRKLTLFRSSLFWAKSLQIALLSMVTIGMLGAAKSRYERIGHELMCACGCGQILLECNHYGCPDSPRMINELNEQVASGASDKTILGWFTAKYGAIILAAPIRGGFDNVAWIMPIGVFLFATAGTFVVVWLWKRRSLSLVSATAGHIPSASPVSPEEAALRERIRRETEY